MNRYNCSENRPEEYLTGFNRYRSYCGCCCNNNSGGGTVGPQGIPGAVEPEGPQGIACVPGPQGPQGPAGTSQIFGTALVETEFADSVLTVRNPEGTAAVLTLTPNAGGTEPVSAHLVITRLA